jgi:arginine decarboxylase-like protein
VINQTISAQSHCLRAQQNHKVIQHCQELVELKKKLADRYAVQMSVDQEIEGSRR